MSIELEAALRSAFRDTASTVVPRPDPMRRLLRRRRRRWAGLTALIAAVALGVGVVPALQPAEPVRVPLPPLPKWTLALLESPTRGSRAGDVDQLFPGGLAGVKVLFFGAAEGRLFLVFVRYDERSATLYHSEIPNGSSLADLVAGAVPAPLGPLLTITSTAVPVVIGLAPQACTIEASIGVSMISPENTVQRRWMEVPERSWVLRTLRELPERWQVTCDDGVVRFNGPAVAIGDVTAETDLIAAAGIQHGSVLARWSGTNVGLMGAWTLSTAQLTDGDSVAVVLTDGAARSTVATAFSAPAGPRAGRGVVSTTVSNDRDVIAVRMPEASGALGERVLIFTAKPGAATVTVRAEIGTSTKPLAGGIAVVNTHGGPISIEDATGAEIGSTWLLEEVPQLFGEKLVSDW